ncbi:MAG: cytidylate kinase family protein [Ferroplasma sp.]
MIITISGESGSGKTTVGQLLAKTLNYEFISGGFFFRKKAEQYRMELNEFSKYAESHPEIDREEDEMIVNFLRSHDNIVLESRLSGFMAYKNNIQSFRIYLNANFTTRLNRLMGRDSGVTRSQIIGRERSEIIRYMEFYGIDYRTYSYYNYIIDTDSCTPDEIARNIIAASALKYTEKNKG